MKKVLAGLLWAVCAFFALGVVMLLSNGTYDGAPVFAALAGLFGWLAVRAGRAKAPQGTCPHCGNRVPQDAVVCARCDGRLQRQPTLPEGDGTPGQEPRAETPRQPDTRTEAPYTARPPRAAEMSNAKKSSIVSIFNKSWSEAAAREFVVLDIETTGLAKTVDRIVEIAAIRYRDGVEAERFVTLVDPECPIPAGARAVHHITDNMVRGAPCIREAMPWLLAFLGDALIVGHNASFDVGFIEIWARRCGHDPVWRYVDTISVAKKMFPGLPNYRQQTILDHIGYRQGAYHRAEEDCRGCAEILLIGLNSVLGTYD